MGIYHTISTVGGVGSYTPPPDAPNILDDTTTVASAYFEVFGHDWKRGLTGTLHLPTADAAYAHLFEIDVIATDANGKTISIPLYAPFVVGTGTTVTWRTDPVQITVPFVPEAWTIQFKCINDLNKATANPTSRPVTITAPVINSASVTEPGPRIITNTGRAVATTLTVTPTLSVNLGGLLGIQYVTIWTKYASGDPSKGPDPITTRKGIFPITGLSTAVSLTGDNQVFITLLTSTVLSVYVALGAWDGTTIPAFATQATYTMAGPAQPPAAGNWITGANFTGLASKLQYYTDGGGGFSYKFGTLAFTATYSTHPTLFSVRCYVQNGKWNGTTWTPDPNDPGEHAFCDAQITKADTNTTIVVGPPLATPDSVTVSVNFPWPMAISTDPYPDNRIHLDAIPTAGAIITQASLAGQTSPCSEIIFSSDGQYAYVQPSIAKALLTAVPWDPLTVGDRLGVVGGKLQVTTPLAPPPVSVTAVINSTSAATLAAIGGLPVWNAVLTITLNTVSVNYAHTKAINISVPGYPDFTIFSWTPDALLRIFVTLPTEYQDISAHSPVASVVAFNEDSVPSAAATVTLSVPAATSPIGGTPAPAATAILATQIAAPVVNCVTWANWWQIYFSDSLTGYASTSTSFIRVSKISPSGQRGPVGTDIFAPVGGFVSGSVYNVIGAPLDTLPLTVGTWTIEWLPVNADGIPGPATSKTVTVTPPTATLGTITEGTRVATSSRGLTTTINVPIGITNNPGGFSGVQQVMVWFTWNRDGTGNITTPQGFWPITGAGSTISISGIFITPLSSATFTVQAFAYPLNNQDPIPGSAAISSFTMFGPLAVTNALVTGLAIDQLIYYSVPGGGFGVKPGTISGTALFSTHPELKSTRFTVEDGTWDGNNIGTWVADVTVNGDQVAPFGARERALTDVDFSTPWLTGNAIKIQLQYPWPYPAATAPNRSVRLRVWADNTTASWVLQSGWPASGGAAGIAYRTDSVILTPDITKATLVIALSAGSLGSGMYLDAAGKVQLVGPTLVTNGSFEADAPANITPTGWQVGGSQSGTIAVAANPAPSAINNSARSVALTGTHSSVVQTFACNPGDGFNLTDYVFSSAANGTMRLVLLWLNSGQGFVGSVEAAQVFATGVWTKMSIAGTVPLGAVFVQIFVGTNGSNNGGIWYADNVDLQPTGKTSAGNGLGFDSSGNLIVSANSEFKFVGGQLQINQVDFTKGFNGFAVGSAAVPQITIAPNGVPLGWIGFDSTSGLSGAWFKRVLIGGANPANAQIFADANGNVTVNGQIIAGTLVSATIAVNNITGWGNSNINITTGVTFTGNSFTTRINIPTFGSLGALAISANGGLVLSTDGVHPHVQLSPSPSQPSIGVNNSTDNTFCQMSTVNGGTITVQNTNGNKIEITSTNIKRNGVVIL